MRPETKELTRMLRSPLPTTKAVFPKRKLRNSLRRLRNTKTRTKSSEKESRPRTPVRVSG